jgi:hypothetical protein
MRQEIGHLAGVEFLLPRDPRCQNLLAAGLKLAAQLGDERNSLGRQDLCELGSNGAADFHAAREFFAHDWDSGFWFAQKAAILLRGNVFRNTNFFPDYETNWRSNAFNTLRARKKASV